jgi:hypothetical protein
VALCQARTSTKPLWGLSSSNPYHPSHVPNSRSYLLNAKLSEKLGIFFALKQKIYMQNRRSALSYSLKAKLSEKLGIFFALKRKKYITEPSAPYFGCPTGDSGPGEADPSQPEQFLQTSTSARSAMPCFGLCWSAGTWSTL